MFRSGADWFWGIILSYFSGNEVRLIMIYVICLRTTDTKRLDVATSDLNLILVTDENFVQFLESARGPSTKNGCGEDDA